LNTLEEYLPSMLSLAPRGGHNQLLIDNLSKSATIYGKPAQCYLVQWVSGINSYDA